MSIERFFKSPLKLVGNFIAMFSISIVFCLYYFPVSDTIRLNGASFIFDYLHFIGGIFLGGSVAAYIQRKLGVFSTYSFIVIVLILLAITGALELFQQFGSRTSSLTDWFNGYCGSLLGITLYYSYVKAYKYFFFLVFFSFGILLIFILVPLSVHIKSHQYYKKNFPVLGSFERKDYDELIWLATGGDCSYEHEYSKEWSSIGESSLKIYLGDGHCRAVKFNVLGYFWSDFDNIAIDVYSTSKKPSSVSIRAFQGLPSHSSHKSKNVIVHHGFNSVVIALQELKKSIRHEAPKLSRLDILFHSEVEPTVFYLDNVRLLKR
jgi:VanZ family protein